MKTPENSKCNRCLHSRLVESENGMHAICTLPSKQAALCVAGLKDKALYLEEQNEHKTPWEIKRSLFCCSEGECHKCYYERECEGRKMAETLLPDVMDYVKQVEQERDTAVECIGHICEAINKPVRKLSDTNNNLMNAKRIALNYVTELAKGVCPENTKEND